MKRNNLAIISCYYGHQYVLALHRFIRIHSQATRKHWMENDKASPIRDLWDLMNANFDINYEPLDNITIGEQLFS